MAAAAGICACIAGGNMQGTIRKHWHLRLPAHGLAQYLCLCGWGGRHATNIACPTPGKRHGAAPVLYGRGGGDMRVTGPPCRGPVLWDRVGEDTRAVVGLCGASHAPLSEQSDAQLPKRLRPAETSFPANCRSEAFLLGLCRVGCAARRAQRRPAPKRLRPAETPAFCQAEAAAPGLCGASNAPLS